MAFALTAPCLLAMCLGCVERKMVVRSEPAGAPVWIDEEAVGTTPLEHPFAHYGLRRVRVGPIRDEKGRVAYGASERVVEVDAPWFQVFPIDFFTEVLWPGKMVDTHELNFVLERQEARPELYGKESAERIRGEAEQFREKALSPVPELNP